MDLRAITNSGAPRVGARHPPAGHEDSVTETGYRMLKENERVIHQMQDVPTFIRWTDWSTNSHHPTCQLGPGNRRRTEYIPHNISFSLSENKYKLNAFHFPYLYLSI